MKKHIQAQGYYLALTIILTCTVFALYTKPASAMNSLSHKLICQLSFDNLPPAAQAGIDTLVAQLPTEHKVLINKYLHRKKDAQITFSDSCNWADAIKHDKKYKQYKKWHYINVNRSHTSITASSCQSECVTTAIKYHAQQLQHTENPWQQLQALMFLGHWLGDIHQPLHVSFASDFGGNKTKIKYEVQEKCDSLHYLWDGCLLASKDQNPHSQLLYKSLYQKLSSQWQNAPINLWQHDNVWQWATESLTISREPEMQYCILDSANQCNRLPDKKLRLNKQYQTKYKPVLEQRILQASVRLAAILQQHLP